jgi:opacity protein-like surface antigen
MRRITELLVATSLCACLSYEAAASEKKYQITSDLGVSHPESLDGYNYSITGQRKDNALAAGLGFSYEISHSLFLGVDCSYRRFEGEGEIKTVGAGTYKISNSDIKVKNFSVNATYYFNDLVLDTKLPTPFITIGGGKSRNIQTNKNIYKLDAGGGTLEQDSFSGKHNAYSYKLGLGLAYPISDGMNLEMRYEHNGFGNIRAYKYSDDITNLADFNETKYNSSLKADSLMGSITYRF